VGVWRLWPEGNRLVMSTESDFPEEGGPGDTLDPSESTDSDEILNDDGDIVVDPPEHWSEADKFGMTAREEREGEPLDQRLAAEEPDVLNDVTAAPSADDADDELPARVHRGQVSGAPEDGDSLFEVVDE
jgi:hypothetical protein